MTELCCFCIALRAKHILLKCYCRSIFASYHVESNSIHGFARNSLIYFKNLCICLGMKMSAPPQRSLRRGSAAASSAPSTSHESSEAPVVSYGGLDPAQHNVLATGMLLPPPQAQAGGVAGADSSGPGASSFGGQLGSAAAVAMPLGSLQPLSATASAASTDRSARRARRPGVSNIGTSLAVASAAGPPGDEDADWTSEPARRPVQRTAAGPNLESDGTHRASCHR